MARFREPPGALMAQLIVAPSCLETKMTLYRAHIIGRHDRSIGVVQLDCLDDESAIQSARRLVADRDVELWQMDRPVIRLAARSKQISSK